MSKKNDLLSRAGAVTSHARSKITFEPAVPTEAIEPAPEAKSLGKASSDDQLIKRSSPSTKTSRQKTSRPTKVRTHPVRLSVDLAPNDHVALKSWCALASAELGIFPIAATDVVRALLTRLHDDPSLAAAVKEDVRRRVL